jgi:hypothetical protein
MRTATAFIVATLVAGESAAAGLSARVDRSEAAVGDAIVLSLVLDGTEGAEPQLPPLLDFDVQRGGQSVYQQIVNGRAQASITYTYVLYPKRVGSFTVGAAEVTLGGRHYQSQPFTLRVVEPSARPQADDKGAFITAEVSTTSPFVSEQVVYTFRFYRRVAVANATAQLPNFDGFVVESLGDQTEYTTNLNGQSYRVTEIRKALFAQQAGDHLLPAATLNVEVASRDKRRRADPLDNFFQSPFDDFFARGPRETRLLRSPPLTLHVRALPPAPPGYSGLVGSFTMEASAAKQSLRVGESGTITIAVGGSGNIQTLGDIALPPSPAYKVYDDKPEVSVSTSGDRLGGRKLFKKAVVPTQPGELRIEVPPLITFDTDSGTYRESTPPPLTFTVLPGSSEDEGLRLTAAPVAGAVVGKQAIEILADDIRPPVSDLSHLARRTSVARRELLLGLSLPALPLMFFGLMLAQRRRQRLRSDTRLLRRRGALRKARRQLKQARRETGAESLERMSRSLREYLGDKLGCPGSALTPEEARHRLCEGGAASDLAERVYATLARIEALQFGGTAAAGGPNALADEITTLVGALERHL